LPKSNIVQRPTRVDSSSSEKDGAQRRSDRSDKKNLAVHVQRDIARDFKVMAAEQSKTTDALMHEALAGLFVMYGKKPPEKLLKKLSDDGLLSHFKQFAPR
jgi:hypothetical protein